jgi:hypothetical protein
MTEKVLLALIYTVPVALIQLLTIYLSYRRSTKQNRKLDVIGEQTNSNLHTQLELINSLQSKINKMMEERGEQSARTN